MVLLVALAVLSGENSLVGFLIVKDNCVATWVKSLFNVNDFTADVNGTVLFETNFFVVGLYLKASKLAKKFGVIVIPAVLTKYELSNVEL